MDSNVRARLRAGARVKVTQQIAARDHAWPSTVRGTVVDYTQRETGSWYAHSKDDRLWLDRLVIRKEDGEITTLNLDDYSRIEFEPAETTSGVPEQKNESDLPV